MLNQMGLLSQYLNDSKKTAGFSIFKKKNKGNWKPENY